jgi:predicted ester cyclase
MSTAKEQNARSVRRFFEEVFTKGDRAVAQEILAPDLVYYGPDEGIHGIDNFFHIVDVMRDTLQIQFRPEAVIVEDEITAGCLTTIQGTHVKEFRGIPPKGASFTLPRIDNFVFENGKIKEIRAVFDHQTMFQMLHEGKKEGQGHLASSVGAR